MKETTKCCCAFLDEMSNLGFKLTYGYSLSNRMPSNVPCPAYDTIEVSFSSSIVQYLVTLLLTELQKEVSQFSFSSGDSLYIYCY